MLKLDLGKNKMGAHSSFPCLVSPSSPTSNRWRFRRCPPPPCRPVQHELREVTAASCIYSTVNTCTALPAIAAVSTAHSSDRVWQVKKRRLRSAQGKLFPSCNNKSASHHHRPYFHHDIPVISYSPQRHHPGLPWTDSLADGDSSPTWTTSLGIMGYPTLSTSSSPSSLRTRNRRETKAR